MIIMSYEYIKRQFDIDNRYNIKDELGVIFSDKKIIFKIWAPFAKNVILNIFDKENCNILYNSYSLIKDNNGIWCFETEENLELYFYNYLIDGIECFDPYAKSISPFRVSPKGEALNGSLTPKGAIVNIKNSYQLSPFRFSEPKERVDSIIYEVHIRDFTSEENLVTTNKQGSYLAFIEKLPYIKSLGVTHIQLLPVMKFFYNDEENKEMEYFWSSKYNNYNWGYDPYSYFVPEGVYASNGNPYTRINELKLLIDAIHKNGMGVVLDVVYTHMATTKLLDNIVPNYYFLFDKDNNLVGDFGNNLATPLKMVRNLILSSIKYWFEEFKIDGMRFDMMGDSDYKLIEDGYKIAKSINEQAIFLGEGWRTFKGNEYNTYGADQDWIKNSDSTAVFSDDFRNILKSGYPTEGIPKFLTNGKVEIKKLFENIKGNPTNFIPYSPNSVIQYIEAHDNATLHDIIAISMNYSTEHQSDIHKRIRLGNFILLTSQGIPFIHSGQEYGRSKEWLSKSLPEQKYIKTDFSIFINDSYDSTDYINSFKWSMLNKSENLKTLEFTKKLINLRKSEAKFRYKTFDEVDKNIELINKNDDKSLLLIYRNSDYLFIINGYPDDISIPLEVKDCKIIVDGDNISIDGILSPKYISFEKKSSRIKGLSAILLKGGNFKWWEIL